MTTTTCELVSQDLPGYAQGKLEAAAAAPVERHVKACVSCQKDLIELRKLDQLLTESLPAISPSPTLASSFANRLAAEIATEEEAISAAAGGFLSWLFRPWLVPAVATAALIAILVVSSRNKENAPVLAVDGGSKVAAPEMQVAGKEPKGAPKTLAKASGREPGSPQASPPAELVDRTDLFVDYAIIEQLELLESDTGSGSAG